MANRAAEKIKRRRERLKENQTQVVVSKPNKLRFWILTVLLISIIIYLSYLAYTRDITNELILLIIVSVIGLLLSVIWYVPKFSVQSLPIETGKTFDREKERLKLEDDTRKTYAQIVGGIVLLGGLFFTYNTFRLQQEGQFTDRFTKAVDQLGDDKLEIRLGGLYALERIAKDSPKDHWTVMEILCAYVREKAKEKEPINKDENNKNIVKESNKSEINSKQPTDIQTALTIIGRRRTEWDSKTDSIDLRGANLSEINLSGANLRRADLSGLPEGNGQFRFVHSTNLRGAYMIQVNLESADLQFADLQFADLRLADLRSANLQFAELKCARLRGADLSDTNLKDADLSCADLSDAKNVIFEQLYVAKIDKNTILPQYLENRRAELLRMK